MSLKRCRGLTERFELKSAESKNYGSIRDQDRQGILQVKFFHFNFLNKFNYIFKKWWDTWA